MFEPLEFSPLPNETQKPPCIYFGACGGCRYQHGSETYYQNWKDKRFHQVLSDNRLAPTVLNPSIFIPQATRRRVTFTAIRQGMDIKIGFHHHRSHEIEPVETCLLLTPRLNDILNGLKPWILKIIKDKAELDVQVQDIDGSIEVVFTGPIELEGKRGTVLRTVLADMAHDLTIYRIGWRQKDTVAIEPIISLQPVYKMNGPVTVKIPMGAFLQPSVEGETALVNLVLKYLPKKIKTGIADLFSGCGTFSGPLLTRGHVHAVEEVGDAVESLKDTKTIGLTSEKRNLFKEPMTVRELKNYDVVVMDPPRSGAKEQCEKLAKSNVGTVVYVSCNPGSFARDAQMLVKGGYVFEQVTMVDQFIWSDHTELVAVFRKK